MTEFNKDRVHNLLSRRGIISSRIVAIVEVGSSALGVTSTNTDDDLDLTVIYWEPSFQHILWHGPDTTDSQLRTQPDGKRSRLGDIDINLYTVRRFAQLTLKANPSILGTIYSPRVHVSTSAWHALTRAAQSRTTAIQPAGSAYLGYATQQIERWQGKRGQKNVSRPELVEAHGYDTKYAYHAIRLAHQGAEYLTTGRLSFPPQDPLRQVLLDVREGRVPEAKALDTAEFALDGLRKAISNSTLPLRANAEGFRTDIARLYAARYAIDWNATP